MKPRLHIEVVPLPRPDADRELDAALDLLASALADLSIAQARAEVAVELGVAPETLDREIGPFAFPLGCLGLADKQESA